MPEAPPGRQRKSAAHAVPFGLRPGEPLVFLTRLVGQLLPALALGALGRALEEPLLVDRGAGIFGGEAVRADGGRQLALARRAVLLDFDSHFHRRALGVGAADR